MAIKKVAAHKAAPVKRVPNIAQAKPENPKRASKKPETIHLQELKKISGLKDFRKLLNDKGKAGKKLVREIDYTSEMTDLQEELVKLQNWVVALGARVAVLFEGRDAAGKSGAIRRFVEALNPRHARIAALSKPTEEEQGQWYFQRYATQLPNRGELVLFDRSWYNRAVVEPVMGFCTEEQYQKFMHQVNGFENMLIEDGIVIVKFWFSISKEEQKKRFADRGRDVVKRWKISPVDKEAQKKWDKYTEYMNKMFATTNLPHSPWIIVQSNNKRKARIESIKYLLTQIPYSGKDSGDKIALDSKIISYDNNFEKLVDV